MMMDLQSFVTNLQANFPIGGDVHTAAQNVLDQLNNVHIQGRNGYPWPKPGTTWNVASMGLTVIAPLTPTLAYTPDVIWPVTLYTDTYSTQSPLTATWSPQPTTTVTLTQTWLSAQDGRWDDFIARWYAQAGIPLTPTVGPLCHRMPPAITAPDQTFTLNGYDSGYTAQLTWTPTSAAATYAIHVKPQVTDRWSRQATTQATTYTQTDLEPGTYTYFVTAQDTHGEAIATSNQVTITITGIEQLTLDADPGPANTKLQWNPSSNPHLHHYTLYRKESGAGAFVEIATTEATHYFDDDTKLVVGTTYTYLVKAYDADNNLIAISNSTNATFGQVILHIPEVWGFPGRTIDIPVKIANADLLRLAGADIRIEYDPAIFTPIAVTATALTQDYQWDYTIEPAGALHRVHIILVQNAASPPLYGDGVLFWITVQVKGAEGASTPLHFIPFQDGGTAIYTPDDLYNPLPTALQDGHFYVDDRYELGDVNGDGFLNVADLYLALQISVGKIDAQPWQIYVCDANGNDLCDPGDVSMLWYRLLHNRWPTAPEIKALGISSTTNTNPTVTIEDVAGTPGSLVNVPILGENLAANTWSGGKFSVAYDQACIANVDSVSLTSLTGEFAMEYEDAAGMVHIALANAEPLTEDGALLRLRLHISDIPCPSTLTPLKLAEVALYDSAGQNLELNHHLPVQREDGSLDIQERVAVYLPLILSNP